MIHKSFCTFLLILFGCQNIVYGQSHYDPDEPGPQTSLSLLDQTKSDLYIITAAGVGGAVLGLSTLSFSSKPSDDLGHIWTGAAVGIIVGVIYVAYRQALGPNGMWSDAPVQEEAAISKNIFLQDFASKTTSNQSIPITVAWNFSF